MEGGFEDFWKRKDYPENGGSKIGYSYGRERKGELNHPSYSTQILISNRLNI